MSPAPPAAPNGVQRFNAIRAQLEPLLQELLACDSHSRDRRPAVPHQARVYLFTQGDNHRYIGRAKDLNQRFGQHVRRSSPQNQASFAFNIARRRAVAAEDFNANRTRKALAADAAFNERFFIPAKAEVRAMQFRFVIFAPDAADADALSTIFEVYASLVLGTEGDFNLFATH